MSILARLILLVLLALAPVSAVQVWNQLDLRRERTAEIHDTALQLLGLLVGEQQRLVEGVRQMLSLLAETDAARDLDPAACGTLLERTRQRLPGYLTVNLAAADGTILCSTAAELSGRNIADRAHVRDALESGGFTVGEFIRRRPSGVPAMPFALPIRRDGGDIAGVVTALIDLGWLEGYLAKHPLPANAALFVADGRGVVLARAPEAPGAIGTVLPDRFRPLLDADTIGTAELVGIDGTPRVFAYVPLAAGVRHIFVAIGVDHDAALAAIDEALRRSLLLTAAALLLSVAAAFLLARRYVHRPIEALVAATRRWRAGDLSARSGLRADGSELSQLARAFDRLAEELEAETRTRTAVAAALQASEARHRAIVETAVDAMVVIDEDGMVQSCNPAAERIFGYAAAEVIGQDVAMLMPEPYHSEHDGYIAAYRRTGVRRIIGTGREVEGRRKDGSTFPLELAIAEWTVGDRRFFTGIMRDVTGRREAEEALRASEERFRELVEHAPQIMWVNGPDGTVEFINAACRAYTGQETTDAGRLSEVHPDDRGRIREARTRGLAAGEPYAFEMRLRRADGVYRWHIARVNPIRQRGRVVAWFGGAVDVHDIHHAREAAEEAGRSKSRFLASASHDLRQPLQSILLFAEALRPHLADGAGQDRLDSLLHGLDVLKGLLDGLLDISRLDAGIVAPQIEDLRVSTVLKALDDAYAPIARGKGLEWQVIPCGAVIRSDRVLLGRMLRNLIENAIRYTQRGKVMVGCTVEADRVLIDVLDTGCGIPDDQLGRIFEEFHQLGNPERDRARGLGLGLAIVRRLSALLDHPVDVRSRAGGGSVFSVAVPLAAEHAEPAPPPASRTAAPTRPENRPDRRFAVVVDDDAIVLMGLETILRDWNFDVLAADSTDRALARLKEADRRPDVLIVDYRLREGRVGTEAVVRIREMCGQQIPGIIVTGEIGAEPQNDAIAHNLGILHKPVTPRLLEAALVRHIQAAE